MKNEEEGEEKVKDEEEKEKDGGDTGIAYKRKNK